MEFDVRLRSDPRKQTAPVILAQLLRLTIQRKQLPYPHPPSPKDELRISPANTPAAVVASFRLENCSAIKAQGDVLSIEVMNTGTYDLHCGNPALIHEAIHGVKDAQQSTSSRATAGVATNGVAAAGQPARSRKPRKKRASQEKMGDDAKSNGSETVSKDNRGTPPPPNSLG